RTAKGGSWKAHRGSCHGTGDERRSWSARHLCGGTTREAGTAEIAQPMSAAAPADNSLRRDVGLVGLLFASLGSIIGAGWLFGALYASQLAGPAAIISWALGGGAVMLLALTHAELGAMYPVSGGSARFPH